MNKEIYIEILRRLGDAVRRKRVEEWRTNCSFLLRYSSTQVGFGQGFLSKEQRDNTEVSSLF